MREALKSRRAQIALFIICILIIVCGILFIPSGEKSIQEGSNKKNDSEQEVIVHNADENTVEEKAESGLTVSESEDGPSLDKENMIDFNGSDKTSNEKNDTDNVTDEENEDDHTETTDEEEDADKTEEPPQDTDSSDTDTGVTWGNFY